MNHSESDHSGALLLLLQERPDIPVYCSAAGKEMLSIACPNMANPIVVEDGSSITIGNFVFSFTYTPHLHWADNMVTYLENEHILFSNDLFGQSLGAEIPLDKYFTAESILDATKAYFETVFLSAPAEALSVVPRIIAANPNMVATGHGVVLQQHLTKVFDYYQSMCKV